MVTVLAVPGSPTNRQGFPTESCEERIQVDRTVSMVGTRILANSPDSGGTYSGTRVDQAFHCFWSMSR